MLAIDTTNLFVTCCQSVGMGCIFWLRASVDILQLCSVAETGIHKHEYHEILIRILWSPIISLFHLPPLGDCVSVVFSTTIHLAVYFHLTCAFVVHLLLLKVLCIPLHLSLSAFLVKSQCVHWFSATSACFFLFCLENYTAAISRCGIDQQFHWWCFLRGILPPPFFKIPSWRPGL